MGLGHGRCNLGFIKKPLVPDIVAKLAILSVFLVALDKLSTRRRAVGLVLAGNNGGFSFSNVLFRATTLFHVRIQGPRLLLFGRYAFRPLAVCGQQQWKRLAFDWVKYDDSIHSASEPPATMISLLQLLLCVVSFVGTGVFAYSETDCNPLNSTCPADAALGTEQTWWFNSTLDDTLWNMTTGDIDYTSTGADFSIKTENASTLLVSNFYIFFGVMEAHVKMAKGAGIISSVILQSDDLDEIDWEWVGYNTSEVQSDFFGKGNTTTSDRGGYHAVANADTEYHNYTSYWDKDRLEWWIDGSLVRTVNYSEPLTVYGKNYPQTPCKVKVSLWPVGIKGQTTGNLEWGGGYVNWTDVPFTMSVQRIRVQDFHSGKEYEYQGHTGTYESINVVR